MNQYKTQSSKQAVPLQPQNSLDVVAAVFKFLSPLELDASTVPQFCEVLDLSTFQLGDTIARSEPGTSTPQSTGCDRSGSWQLDPLPSLYVVCRGRVRLLCWNAQQQREVSVQALDPGESFGADQQFHTSQFEYRAVATGDVKVARLASADLELWLSQVPPLRDLLTREAVYRERLIFLKTCTSLQALASSQIQPLLPHISEIRLPPNTILSQADSSLSGHCWLYQGVIQSQNAESIPPQRGDGWGYPDSTPTDWVTQTDVVLYQLPIKQSKTVFDSLQEPFVALPAANSLVAPDVLNIISQTSTNPRSTISQGNGSLQANCPVEKAQPVMPVKRGEATRCQPIASVPKKPSEVVSCQPIQSESPTVCFPQPQRSQWRRRLRLNYPFVQQQSSSDCGAACLAMIASYWGKQFPLHVLREKAHIGRSGASLKNLATAAEGIGFHARPVRASLGRVAELSNPWIAHWQGDHYVVVHQIKAKRVILVDPALGRRSLARQEFLEHWTGFGLLLEPTERLQQIELKQSTLARYLHTLSPYRGLIIQILLFSILIQLFGLITPLFTQVILDQIVVQKSLPTLHVFVTGLLLFSVGSIFMSSVRQYLLSYFSNRLDLTLISGFIRHTLTLPLKFFESRRVGDILTRVQENQKIQRFLIGQVVLTWLDFLTGFVYLGLMLYYNWQLTLLVLALIPAIVLLTLAATPLLRRVSREIFQQAAEQNSALVEMLNGIATIKATAAEQDLRWRWEGHLTNFMNVQFRGQQLGIKLQATSGLINSLGSTALLWYGATLVIQDQLTIGQFVAFNMMKGYVIGPVISLANLWDELQEVLISIERLNDVFEAIPEEPAQVTTLVMPTIQGTIEFEDVTFRYCEDTERNTLQNISFIANPGQTIAIVGRSGSGKTTLVRLLQGLYRPDRGRVLVDGHDIRHVALNSLRSQLGVVPQECFLFSGTIFDNITLYRSEVALEQVVEVAKLAEAHAFIQALPLGYNTKVGEQGSSLSGGQRQRIAIARALLGNPRILVLDEATSSLDTESERRFQRNLAQISRDRTTFIIAHRLSTVRNADTILVLDQGVLVEQGTHEQLVTAKGLYCHLAQQQLDL
jgi:ATP-binding cassette subfamily B protein